ncbi:MAG: diguanylate cyclase [Chloroflexi bacterium]|nr:diguanylate cyclase [Chloroflexota bacterium]
MPLLFTPYSAVLILTALVSAATAYAAWRRRPTPYSTVFITMMLVVTGYALIAAMEATAVRVSDKLFWSKLEYVGSNGTALFFLLFSLAFTGRQVLIKWWTVILLGVVPYFDIMLVATNDLHGLVWPSLTPGPAGSNQLVYGRGPGFFWAIAVIYVYVLVGVGLLAEAAIRRSGVLRNQALAALGAAAAPVVGSLAYALGATPPGLNVVPMSFTLTGLGLLVSIFRLGLFDLVPVARDMLVERMDEGLLVVDAQERIIDLNPAARRLLHLPPNSLGLDAQKVLAERAVILNAPLRPGAGRVEILIDTDPARYLTVRRAPLRDRRGTPSGALYLLHDTTDRRQVEAELHHANDQLQEQLKEIEALQSELREQAIRDTVTGLFNRRYLEETLPRELALAGRRSLPLALIMLDVDHFKTINDSYGHEIGDDVLRTLGELLAARTRSSDVACRYGGEEFVVALPGMPPDSAHERAEQIRRAFSQLRFRSEAGEFGVTLSGGVASFPADGETDGALMRSVDQALYAAKHAGRNCIRVAPAP